jgi:hypothetical protein
MGYGKIWSPIDFQTSIATRLPPIGTYTYSYAGYPMSAGKLRTHGCGKCQRNYGIRTLKGSRCLNIFALTHYPLVRFANILGLFRKGTIVFAD